jgi:hypothetical protein
VQTLYKFGFNAAVGTSYETIAETSGLITYPSSATALKVSSADTDDTSSDGNGAQTVRVSGLDSNYRPIEETVSLTGQTEALTTNSYLRVFRAEVLTAGSSGFNEGIIYFGTGTVTAGVPATEYMRIGAENNQTLHCSYTVPADNMLYVTSIVITTAGNANAIATAQFVARETGGVWQVKDQFTANRAGGVYQLDFRDSPRKFPAKTDIELRSKSDQSTDVSGVIQGVLVPSGSTYRAAST